MAKFELKCPWIDEFRSTNDQFHVVGRFGRDSYNIRLIVLEPDI